MKIIKYFSLLIILIAVVTACKDKPVKTVIKTVTFHNGTDSSAIPVQRVAHGEKATKPSKPVKAGFIFDGWYKEKTFTNAFNFNTETITKNITLYAKWIKDDAKNVDDDSDPPPKNIDDDIADTFAFDETSYNHVFRVDDNIFEKTPTLIKDNPADKRSIVYSIMPSDEDTTIDKSTGKIILTPASIHNKIFTITAKKLRTEKYKASTTQYTLTVKKFKPMYTYTLAIEIESAMEEIGNTVDLSYIDTSSITDMSYLFSDDILAGGELDEYYGLSEFNGNISEWDVSSVTDMSFMFNEAVNFNGDIPWGEKTSNVKNMSYMFQGATSFNQNISAWNVSSVTDMSFMFASATSFNQNLSAWNVSSVTDMSFMFASATSFNQNLSAWDVSNVTNMSYMFQRAETFNSNILWGEKTSNVKDMSRMFDGAKTFNKNISAWNVSNVTDMRRMFEFATSFNQDLSAWDVSNVTNMSYMFQEAETFNSNILWGEKTSNVKDMNSMFDGAKTFNKNISAWNVSNVTDMSLMFRDAIVFNQNISTWNVSNVTDMSFMFSTEYEGNTNFNQDLSTWDVSSVTDMSYMFAFATKFNQNISTWDVSSVTNMRRMFRNATKFNQNLSAWDVSSVTDMRRMFAFAEAFKDKKYVKSWGRKLSGREVKICQIFLSSLEDNPPQWYRSKDPKWDTNCNN